MKAKLIVAAIALTIAACAEKKPTTSGIDGKKIYKQNCVLCHGADGKLGANGSKDLTKSILTLDEKKAIIKNGKGKMIGLGGILNAEEIEAVALFTQKLK